MTTQIEVGGYKNFKGVYRNNVTQGDLFRRITVDEDPKGTVALVPNNAASLNAVSVLGGSIGIPLNRTSYWYLLYMYSNEMDMTQPKVVLYIVGGRRVYAMDLFQCSFVSLSTIKITTVFSEIAVYLHMYMLSSLI